MRPPADGTLGPPAPGRVLQGRAGHRAVLHRERRQPGPSRQRFLRQVCHRQRLHPLAERGAGGSPSNGGLSSSSMTPLSPPLPPPDDRDRVLQGPQRLRTQRDALPGPGLEAAARAPQAQPPAAPLPPPRKRRGPGAAPRLPVPLISPSVCPPVPLSLQPADCPIGAPVPSPQPAATNSHLPAAGAACQARSTAPAPS